MKPSFPHLTCQELTELVTDYLERKLSLADRLQFELHLLYCRGCRAYLEQLRDVLRATGRIAEESISPHARGALLDAFRGWKKGASG